MKDLQIITDKINEFKANQFEPFHKELTCTFRNSTAAMLWELAKVDDSIWRFKLNGQNWSYYRNDIELEPKTNVVEGQDFTYGEWVDDKVVPSPWNKALTIIDNMIFRLINEHMEMFQIDFVVTQGGGPFSDRRIPDEK